MKSDAPTIHDVAAAAGVSAATVSRHLQGQRVRTAERIGAVIDELQFRPRPAAQSLKSGVTGSVAVVVPDITNPFFAAVVKGVESVSRQGDYAVQVYNTEESSEREAAILDLLHGRVDGVILTTADESDGGYERLKSVRMPIVLLDREVGERFDSVLIDNVDGAAQAAAYVAELGHADVGIISGPLDTTPGRTRHHGFLDALGLAGIEPRSEHVQVSDFREDGGYQTTLRLLGLECPPSAIFATNNLMCTGMLRALHAMRVRVPEEVSVIGFDDLQLAELLNPPLTVVDRPMEEQGALAMRLLLKRLGDPSARPRRIVLETRLVVRDSCAPHAKTATSARPTTTREHQP